MEKVESQESLKGRDVEKAILNDLPLAAGELGKMRKGIGSALHRTVRVAYEVSAIPCFSTIIY